MSRRGRGQLLLRERDHQIEEKEEDQDHVQDQQRQEQRKISVTTVEKMDTFQEIVHYQDLLRARRVLFVEGRATLQSIVLRE